jgi:hypothetical protein
LGEGRTSDRRDRNWIKGETSVCKDSSRRTQLIRMERHAAEGSDLWSRRQLAMICGPMDVVEL